eukprot:TRINITY_DN6020_c0_g1_i1.p1 TRINITY_DN6020_c0_g1~~TRINITY_DN6020_c0_g1_i1.p1  ORF type:complete len:762 (+),score=190.40 TRINITY_DN6020_c0_g1_i1:477-2762(+)
MESRSQDLFTLYMQNIEYKEMIRILDLVEQVRTVPEQLEAAIEAKLVLRAVKLMQDNVTLLLSEDLGDIEALSDIRKTIMDRKNTFHEQLINELMDHIYLKGALAQSAGTYKPPPPALPRDVVADDAENPTGDSARYIRVLLVALHQLNKLKDAVQDIMQRHLIELRTVIEETVTTVRAAFPSKQPLTTDEQGAALKMLLESVFDRYLIILRNHAYVLNVMDILNAQKTADAVDTYQMKVIWTGIYNELQGLLTEYLGASNSGGGGPGRVDEWSLMHCADGGKFKLFRFGRSQAAIQASSTADPLNDYKPMKKAEVLVPASVHHVVTIYKQVVRFNDDALEIFAKTAQERADSSFRVYVDDFIQHTFMFRLKAEVMAKMQSVCNEAGFRTPEPSVAASRADIPTHEGRLVVPAAEIAVDICRQVAGIVHALQPYATDVLEILLDALHRLRTYCDGLYEEVLGPKLCSPIVEAILDIDAAGTLLVTDEIDRLLQAKDVQRDQIVEDPQQLALFAGMADGLQWLIEEMTALFSRQQPVSGQFQPQDASALVSRPRKQPTKTVWISDHVGHIVVDLKRISRVCVLALAAELRCHCIFGAQEVRKGQYCTDDTAAEPEPFVVELNRHLATTADRLAAMLPRATVEFLLSGLGRTLSRAVVQAAKDVTRINANGVQKICRNLSALQQNLSNIVSSDDQLFERVRQFFELITGGEDEIIAHAAANTKFFMLRDYKWVSEMRSPRRKHNEQTMQEVARALGAKTAALQ